MNNLIKKGVVVAVILLFVSVALAPIINANVDRRVSENVTNSVVNEIVEITVSQHKADGTIEKTFIEVTKSKALELKEKLKQIPGSKETFALLKEYDLVPKDVTLEQLRQGMLNAAERLGVTEEKVADTFKEPMCKTQGIDRFWWCINFFNRVGGMSVMSISLPIGISLFTGLLNCLFLLYNLINSEDFEDLIVLLSADLFYINAFALGIYVFKNGTLPDGGLCPIGVFSLGGFVGFVISFPFFSPYTIMAGFSIVSFGFSINPFFASNYKRGF